MVGTDTVMIAANNGGVESVGFCDLVSLEMYRLCHNISEDTFIDLVTQGEDP